MTKKRSVAFAGLGRMGTGMAMRLLNAGFDVAVYNRSPSKAEALAKQGARVADTPAEAADGVEAFFCMVADDMASKTVWLGETGALAALHPSAFVIETSTISHDWVEELSGLAANKNLRYLDSPVTGLPDAAARGELTLLMGADKTNLHDANEYLAPISNNIIHFGPVGAGTVYKLMINLMGAVQIAAAAEGMALAEKAGLDPLEVAGAIAVGQAASPQVVRHTGRMARDDHYENVGFTAPLRLKDAEYGVQLMNKLGLASPLGERACDAFRKMCDQGLVDVDESKVIDIARAAKLTD